MERTDFFVERTDYFMELGTMSTIWPWNKMTGYRHAPSRLTTNEQIKIFVTENTESDTFCMEEYSEKYTIVVWNSLLR